jgi:hypothetical protein
MKPKGPLQTQIPRVSEIKLTEKGSKRQAVNLNAKGKPKNSIVEEKVKKTIEDSNTEYFTSRKASLDASKEIIDNREIHENMEKKAKLNNLQGLTAVSFAHDLQQGFEGKSALSTTANIGAKFNRTSLKIQVRHSRGLSEGSHNTNIELGTKTSFLSDSLKRKSEKGSFTLKEIKIIIFIF